MSEPSCRQGKARDVDADLLGYPKRTGKVRLGQQQDELVACVACRHVGDTDVTAQDVGDGLQQPVA